ncbi:hypothetical protein BDV41DRAFT_535798 [Aspergillus transmontanensis]|uniref:Uncharacterized protein n=1 Tax=Aspergillus transmontanensis TaxID=1034304 RepID=A0A5N6VZE1_9EURO|nr:hypothetical protein BDV41DRAFT_535798 [Aspergillus transmontanensis]
MPGEVLSRLNGPWTSGYTSLTFFVAEMELVFGISQLAKLSGLRVVVLWWYLFCGDKNRRVVGLCQPGECTGMSSIRTTFALFVAFSAAFAVFIVCEGLRKV